MYAKILKVDCRNYPYRISPNMVNFIGKIGVVVKKRIFNGENIAIKLDHCAYWCFRKVDVKLAKTKKELVEKKK